ncbi:MAG: hypothetical protein M3N19_04025 [Candidatus Eremiobacteraeota bacterium]|nr:hypothetical protein [Candidatus Eremiobacteraeota bacterium]
MPANLRHAAAIAESDHRGIVGFQISWETEARGGLFHQRFHYRNAYVYEGEHLIGARALEKVDNGRVSSERDLEAETKRILDESAKPAAPGFAVPFDVRHFEEYRYKTAPCDDYCLQSDERIAFAALIQDANHGDGLMTIDRDGHVRRLEYSPKVKPVFGPVRAREALISIDRGPVLPGYWATTKIESRFSGRYGFVTGAATQTTHYDHYRRFRTTDAALAALRSGEI